VKGLRLLLAAALGLTSTATPVFAGDKDPAIAPTTAIEAKLLASGKQRIDPAKGYIFQRWNARASVLLLRVPDEQDYADYDLLIEKGFVKAVKSYQTQSAGYDADVRYARQHGLPVPAKPVEPKRETFTIADIANRMLIGVGPTYVFEKAAGTDEVSYLQEVKPGTYIYYGPMFGGPNGYFGTCYCMGGVRFEVKAGQITDLGNFLNVAPDYAAQVTPDIGPKVVLAKAAEPTYGLPAALASYPSARAEFHASGKLNNIFKATVSRMPPVPGVLAYDRDVAVDVATGAKSEFGFPRRVAVKAGS
jgi:hypothetical protein